MVVRVKQENNLIKDAEGLAEGRGPNYVYNNVIPKDNKQKSGIFFDIEIWDEENSTWSDVDKFLRALKVKERKKEV